MKLVNLIIVIVVMSMSVAYAAGAPTVSSSDLSNLRDAIKAKDSKKSRNAISVVLSKDPKNLPALNALGVMYFNSGKYGLARIVFERALKDHPNESSMLYNNLGVMEQRDGELEKAIAYFGKAIALDDENYSAKANLGSIYLDYGNSKGALPILKDAFIKTQRDISRGGKFAIKVANNYAVALAKEGKYDEASDIYNKLIDGKSRDTDAMVNYAILLVRDLKKKKDAIRLLSKLKLITEDKKILNQVSDLEKELDALK